MRILLDNNVNHRFGRLLTGHEVMHEQDLGWQDLQNGDLIAAAEAAGYRVLVTADKGMQFQQSLKGRTISVVVLHSVRIVIEDIAALAPQVLARLENLPQGSFLVVNQD